MAKKKNEPEGWPPIIREIEEREGMRIVRARGVIDFTAVAQVEEYREKTKARREFKYKNVLLDFKEVTHIDTSAIATILKVMGELKEAHHKLVMVHVPKVFRDMLNLFKLQGVIVLYDTEADAVRALELLT